MDKSLINTPPWQGKGISYRTRFLARMGFVLLLMITCPLAVSFIPLLLIPSRKTGNFWDDSFPFILGPLLIGLGTFAIIKLFPLLRAPISFTTSYAPVVSTQLGQPIEVWYEEIDFQRSLKGKGVILFAPEELIIGGNIELAIGMVLILDIARKLLAGERVVGKVPYKNITQIIVKGRYIRLNIGGNNIFTRYLVSFYVSESDGERIYRELKLRFPSAIEYMF